MGIQIAKKINSQGFWVGADPGGKCKFGLAILNEDNQIQCATLSSVDEALQRIALRKGNFLGLGIDAPMWWSSGKGGGRKADQRLRDAYGIPSGSVQSVSSLRGAALVGGALLAYKVREMYPTIKITESHPKALLMALFESNWKNFAMKFNITTNSFNNEHERDAIIAAVCAREGCQGQWKNDLSKDRYSSEQDPEGYWLSPMHYFWPEAP